VSNPATAPTEPPSPDAEFDRTMITDRQGCPEVAHASLSVVLRHLVAVHGDGSRCPTVVVVG
jgi:hypothetical protein